MISLVATHNLPQIEEIEFFLYGFRALKEKYGIIFFQRKKNTQALLDLEISAEQRVQVLDELSAADYYKGPREDGVNIGAEFWEFGKVVNGKEVYIKISLGVGEQAVRCFSFHPAERKIKYPNKKNKTN